MANQSYFEQNLSSSQSFSNDTLLYHNSCPFQTIINYSDLIPLIRDPRCYRHSLGFTIFLFVSNLIVLLFGILGNALVMFVAICRLKIKAASSIFILNLAIADMLVLISCIPATLLANVFTAWIFSETTCKIVAYNQRLSVFCSVYSLVAISFDRCRAMQTSLGTASNISTRQACKIVLAIWTFGFAITLPWIIFKEHNTLENPNVDHVKSAFCQEIWKTSTHEAVYFLLVQVVARFAVPFLLITICSIFLWKSLPTDVPPPLLLIPTCIDFRDTQRRRKVRVVKVFTALNFAFLVFWLPLYVITARLNFEHHEKTEEMELEHQLVSYLIPIAQLLGSCNNCLNPVLYCFLSKTFREPLFSIFRCILCSFSLRTPSLPLESNVSIATVVYTTQHMETRV